MSVNLNFNAAEVEPATPFETLPKGKYLAIISDSDLKDAASGAGQYLQFEYTVVDGEHQGRKLWSRHNIQHTNKTAEEIGRRELSAICHATGVLHITDSAELHDKPLVLDVGIEKRKDTGEDTNRIKGYQSANGELSLPAAQPANKVAATKAPPWATKKAAA